MVHFSIIFTALTVFSSAVSAHPGEHESATASTLTRLAHFRAHSRRSLAACRDTLKARDLESRAIARRSALADEIRQQRGIVKKRSVESVLATNHKTNLTGITSDINSGLLFSGDVKCVLQPEVTQGPYYISGELIRHDLREGQAGVDLWADVQMIDINTCEPAPNIYLDWWHANATGVYSGVVASGNGDSSDPTNINTTVARGLRPTDPDGVAQLLTIFPGHYTGRATHVHILAHVNATLHPNQTLSGGYNAHVGQLFFDQSLISTVSAVAPYTRSAHDLTLNADDTILAQEAAANMDPVMEYALLGDSVEDGVLAWITIGLDVTARYSISSAATWTAHGGVANEGGAGGASSSGAAPSGAAPSSGFHSLGALLRRISPLALSSLLLCL
ncbi:aromatic compound dioxygenase [Choiromyces venosus 120613-1]|uniref:Aromatic compound dioxygenase n=1 Tax=Choiromyces venosus 120613-1 TaxID=1336337 RepID=A0A3N4K2F3_9PEZI|nr:aromatic compound dioxygenase [Choiromyces venosus 120613-1]